MKCLSPNHMDQYYPHTFNRIIRWLHISSPFLSRSSPTIDQKTKISSRSLFGILKAKTLYWSSFSFKAPQRQNNDGGSTHWNGAQQIRDESCHISLSSYWICSSNFGGHNRVLDIVMNTEGYLCVSTNTTESQRCLMMDRIITDSY